MSAHAQLEDLLSPLTPEKKESVKKKKKKKPARAKKAIQAEPEPLSDDQLIGPLVQPKGDVLVKVSGPTDGAVVTINGQPAKAGTKISLDAGEHTIDVTRPGFADFTKKVTVTGGGLSEITAELEAVAGVLTVNSDVPGATVLFDGKVVGPAPIRAALVSPGTHEVIVRREGFEDSISRISVRAGRDYTVEGTLKPAERTTTIAAADADRPERTRLVPAADTEPGPLSNTEKRVEGDEWYKRWYVWAGVGAVVVAAATTTAVAASSTPKGLTPSEVCDFDPNDGKPGACDDVINAPAALLRLGVGMGVRF